jgi:hypothetical protein
MPVLMVYQTFHPAATFISFDGKVAPKSGTFHTVAHRDMTEHQYQFVIVVVPNVITNLKTTISLP